MVFLASEVGDSVPAAEVLDFVDSCRINFVVFDFAWITYHWQLANMDVLKSVCQKLKDKNVRVAVMYRARALHPSDAQIHYAKDKDGVIAASHNDICLAHEDSQEWGSHWGSQLLEKLPTVNAVILYNLRTSCQCAECRDADDGHARDFLRRCRTEWNKLRPGVQVGHVGTTDQYASVVDFVCPFLAINRPQEDATPEPFPRSEFERLHANLRGKWMAPLMKVCWASETHNSTADLVQTIRDCEQAQTGFLLWYYDWVLHSDDHQYDSKRVVEALGGDWHILSRYYAAQPTTSTLNSPGVTR